MYQKPTPARDAIWQTITKQAHVFSVNSLRRLLPKINKATLYRSIQNFLQNDTVDAVYHDGKEQWYEVHEHSKKHHHHALCIKCRNVLCVPCRISTPPIRGFHNTHHTAWFSGTCTSCQ